MGAYVYKLSGIRNYLELNIEGKQELVYEIEYWWKPFYTLRGDESKPRTYKQTVTALKRAFKDRPVNFISMAGYENIFRVTHGGFTDVMDNHLGEDCYPLVDQSLIK